MKNLFLALGIVLVWVVNTNAAETDFRQTSWGMTKAEVQAIEGKNDQNLVDETLVQSILTYERWVASAPVRVVYVFLNDHLTTGIYLFTDRYSENALYLKDYEKIGMILKKKYGLPADEHETWVNDSLKGRPDLRRTAIATGQLRLKSTWQTNTTEVEHALQGDEYEITHSVTYRSLAHQSAVKLALEAQHLKDF